MSSICFCFPRFFLSTFSDHPPFRCTVRWFHKAILPFHCQLWCFGTFFSKQGNLFHQPRTSLYISHLLGVHLQKPIQHTTFKIWMIIWKNYDYSTIKTVWLKQLFLMWLDLGFFLNILGIREWGKKTCKISRNSRDHSFAWPFLRVQMFANETHENNMTYARFSHNSRDAWDLTKFIYFK